VNGAVAVLLALTLWAILTGGELSELAPYLGFAGVFAGWSGSAVWGVGERVGDGQSRR